MQTLKEIILEAKNFYFNEWRGNEKVCPAFNEVIYVTKLGWNHVSHHPRRTLTDKIIRLKKIKLAKLVLEKATTYQTIEKKGKYYRFGLTAVEENIRIKVVVASTSLKGKKEIYSWMFKSLTRAERIAIDKHNQKIIDQFRRENPRVYPKRR